MLRKNRTHSRGFGIRMAAIACNMYKIKNPSLSTGIFHYVLYIF